ncbi:MAG: DUF1523 family protein [archaeon]
MNHPKLNLRNQIGGFKIMFISILGLILLAFISTPIYVYGTSDTVTIQVEDKERIMTDDESYYLVFGKDEVFSNRDSLLKWKFNSSDIQRDLKEDNTYEVEVYGWRIPFLSSYRNIVEIKE